MKIVQIPEYNTSVGFPDDISESEMKRVVAEKFPPKISEAEREVGKYLPGMVPKLWREQELLGAERIKSRTARVGPDWSEQLAVEQELAPSISTEEELADLFGNPLLTFGSLLGTPVAAPPRPIYPYNVQLTPEEASESGMQATERPEITWKPGESAGALLDPAELVAFGAAGAISAPTKTLAGRAMSALDWELLGGLSVAKGYYGFGKGLVRGLSAPSREAVRPLTTKTGLAEALKMAGPERVIPTTAIEPGISKALLDIEPKLPPQLSKTEKRGKQALSKILAEEPIISTPLKQAQALGWRADKLERLTPEDLNLVLAEQLTPKEASITPTGKLVSFKRATPIVDLPPKEMVAIKQATKEVEATLAKILQEEGPSIAEIGWKATDVPGFALLPVTDIATQESDPGERQLALLAAAVMTMPILLISRGQLLARLPSNPKIQKSILGWYDKMPKLIQDRIRDVKIAPWMVGSGQVGQWSGGVMKIIPVGVQQKSVLIPWAEHFYKGGVSPDDWIRYFHHETGHVYEGIMTKKHIPFLMKRADELGIQVDARKLKQWSKVGYRTDKKIRGASEYFADLFETHSIEEMNYLLKDAIDEAIVTSQRDTAIRLGSKVKLAPTELILLKKAGKYQSEYTISDEGWKELKKTPYAAQLRQATTRDTLGSREQLKDLFFLRGGSAMVIPPNAGFTTKDVLKVLSKRELPIAEKVGLVPHPSAETVLPISKALRSSVALRDKSTGGIYTSEGASSHLEIAEKRNLLTKAETLERGWIIEGKYYSSQKEALDALYLDTTTKLKSLEASPVKLKLEKLLQVAESKIPKPLMSKLREDRGSFIWGRGRKTQPPVELPPSADNVELMYQATHDAMEELTKLPKGAIRQKFVHSTIDISGNVKRELLQKGGILGREAVIQKDLLAGLPARTNQLLEPIQEKIYGNLSKADEQFLNDIISSRRTIAIESYKPGIKSPWGQNATAHQAWLNRKAIANPQKFAELNAKAEEFYAVAREQLDDLLNGGLINQQLHTKLYSIDYEPREFIQHIDTLVGQESGTVAKPGVLIDIHNSGIKALDEGSYNLLNNDSRKFLHQIVGRTQARIARNDANKVLYNMATTIPNNGVISLLTLNQPIPTGYAELQVFIGGQPHRMSMPVEMAAEWRQADPGMNRLLSETLSWVFGAKIVRALATGYNPAFAITNVPKDVQLIWMGGKEYSAIAPKAMVQMAIDAKAVWRDAVFRKGRFNDYLNEGGGMELLAHYGRVGGSKEVNKLSRVLGYIGETSEIGTRLMLRERAIKNLRAKFPTKPIEEIQREATWIARSYLDFSQGGQYIKAIDNVIPYLSAAVQATRTLARAAKSDPKTFIWKSAQLMGIAMALNLANRMVNPEGLAQTSPQEKAANWVFHLPEKLTRYVDRKGNTRYWFPKIAKDQGQRIISAIGDAFVDRMIDGTIPSDQLLKSFQDLMPVGPDIPPTLKLWYSYTFNKDFWTTEANWKGSPLVEPTEQWYPGDTPPGFIRMGKALGMSPAKLHGAGKAMIPYSNPFVTMLAISYETISGDLTEEVRRKVPIELILEEPTVRRLTGRTSPYVQVRKEQQEIKTRELTKNVVQNRTIDDLTERGLRRKDQKFIQEAIGFITKQDPVDQDRLAERMLLMKTYINLPDRSWWIDLRQTSDPETRAMVFYAKYLKVPKPKQDEMVQILTSVKGLVSERFAAELIKLKRGKK